MWCICVISVIYVCGCVCMKRILPLEEAKVFEGVKLKAKGGRCAPLHIASPQKSQGQNIPFLKTRSPTSVVNDKKNPCYISKEGWRLLKAVNIILSVSCFGKWDKLPWVIFCGFRVSITGHGLEMPSHLIVFTSLKCTPAVKRRISVILFFIVHFRKCSLIYLPVCDEAESGVCLSNNLPASNSNSCYAFLRQHCHHFSIQSMLTASLSLM